MQRLPSDDIQQREHEGRNLGHLEDHRTDKACRWITEVPAFKYWLTGRDPQSLVLLGKLGFGKTFTIAYVMQYLKSRERRWRLCPQHPDDRYSLDNSN